MAIIERRPSPWLQLNTYFFWIFFHRKSKVERNRQTMTHQYSGRVIVAWVHFCITQSSHIFCTKLKKIKHDSNSVCSYFTHSILMHILQNVVKVTGRKSSRSFLSFKMSHQFLRPKFSFLFKRSREESCKITTFTSNKKAINKSNTYLI